MAKKHLGDYVVSIKKFEGLTPLFTKFKKLDQKERMKQVSFSLLHLIQKGKEKFLLPAVIDFIDRIHKEKILEHYTFSTFEIWLNQFSGVSSEENYAVRAKIVGKNIPREEYQLLFPIGMGKTWFGSHLVTAHSSPDLDTTVASFWGWMDAFGARVSEGLHIWNLPGGPPASQVEIFFLFDKIFGENVFQYLIKDRSSLSLSSVDLMTQKGVLKKSTDDSTFSIDHERNENAIILVDEEGFYLGDWRNFDVEGVRQVIVSLNICLRWFENYLHLKLIGLFAKEKLSKKDLPVLNALFETKMKDAPPVKEFSEKQVKHVEDYLIKIFGIKKGLHCTFEEFAYAMKGLKIFDFQEFITLVENLKSSSLFDKAGNLIENRPHIFHQLEKIIQGLDKAIGSVRNYVERLGVSLKIKQDVFGYHPQPISHRADIDEVKAKIGNYPYLTVTAPDGQGNLIPLGVVHSQDIHKPILGTVSLRDFCNREETKIPSYLEVISVIDHHKSSLNTSSPPVAFISDMQSSNAIVAELAFKINDRYTTFSDVDLQVKAAQKNLKTLSDKRVFQRLLQKQMIAEHNHGYYISPEREYVEYLHFLYAILDDTDLLTKVSVRDLECVASLLNRMKSLAEEKEVEILSLDDLKRDKDFAKTAASRILQNPDMYSLYSKIYLAKEETVEENIKLCLKKEIAYFFADTKEQNSCCRVGQTKMFARNFPLFFKHATAIRKIWCDEAILFNKERPEFDFHLQMISTIAGAEDVYKGTVGKYTHEDEIWIWISPQEQGMQHLRSFLIAFKALPQLAKNPITVEFLGDHPKDLEQIFSESFPEVKIHKIHQKLPVVVLRFKAGLLNSRKAMISPYLPRLVT